MLDRLLNVPAILEAGVSDVVSVFDAFDVGIYCADLDGTFTYVNPAGQTLLGWDAEELLGRRAHDVIHHSRSDGSPLRLDECPFYAALQGGAAERRLDDVFWTKDGSPVSVAHTIAPLYQDGQRIGAIVVFSDISERRRYTELLRARAAQQAALAALGLEALGGGGLHALLNRACVLVAETLDVELSQVLELLPGETGLRLVAGVGWREGVVGKATVGLDRGSLAGFALACDEPVVVEDLGAETRFRAPPLLLEHEVVSGVSVVIHGRDRPWGTEPWGALNAHSRKRRTFTADDISFLSTIANTLALAIERGDAERELHQRNNEMTMLAAQVGKLADDRRRIMADALDAEDRTRARISQLLHDEVLQAMLTARQDLAKARANETARDHLITSAKEAVVAAISELRNAVVALHPVTLEHGGLPSAVKSIADLHAVRAGFDVGLNLEPEAGGVHDQLIISLVRELLNNAAQHADAHHVTITLRRVKDGVLLEVVDDGRGMHPARAREAFDQGHVGLASIALRVESLGGSFQLVTDRGEGTLARVWIPAEPPSKHGDRKPATSRRTTR